MGKQTTLEERFGKCPYVTKLNAAPGKANYIYTV